MTWQPFLSTEPSTEKTVWVSRHGLSKGNEANIVQHWDDYELSDTGIKQAEQARNWWRNIPIQWVITSPVLRARQTADIIFRQIDDIDTGWAEQAAPTLTGQLLSTVAEEYPHLLQPNGWAQVTAPRDPIMEHFDTVTSRAVDALLRATQSTPAHVTNIAVITHGGVLAGLLHETGQENVHVNNLFVLKITVNPLHGWKIRSTHSPLDHSRLP